MASELRFGQPFAGQGGVPFYLSDHPGVELRVIWADVPAPAQGEGVEEWLGVPALGWPFPL